MSAIKKVDVAEDKCGAIIYFIGSVRGNKSEMNS